MSEETYWLTRLAAYGEGLGMRLQKQTTLTTAFELSPATCRGEVSDDSNIREYLVDSAYVAISHPEKRIAFRALLQCHQYYERLRANNTLGCLPPSFLLDCFAVARNRVEGWLQ